uniref:Uncharacterized protein n=1 Tax=Heliothis virescens TaxID=7102 RepID=A0A2A4JWJ7_HELVI
MEVKFINTTIISDRDYDDLMDLSDSSETDSSTDEGEVFAQHIPFVLELHDIRKDEPLPTTENATPATPKLKKHRKRRKTNSAKDKTHSSGSTDSLSEASSIAPSAAEVKDREEFYDAHESYHAMPENQGPIAVAAVARMQAHSETSQNPKAAPHVATPPEQQTTPPTIKKEPSAVTVSTNRDFTLARGFTYVSWELLCTAKSK